jgi:dCTP deaminase
MTRRREGQPKSGVLSCQELKKSIEKGIISSTVPIDDGQVQPASIDLRLGGKAYALVSSLLPEKGQKVIEILHTADMYGSDLVKYTFDIKDGGILERGVVYLIPLMEELKLPKDVGGKANPKSTTGRLDMFTRVITDSSSRFDYIDHGYEGKLYLEVMPRSFTIRVKEGLSLSQLRLRSGKCYVDDEKLEKVHFKKRLLYIGDNHVPPSKVKYSHGIFMSVDLEGDGNEIIGYKAKKNSHVVDLTKRNFYNIADFWEPIFKNTKHTLILEPEEFYILASKEKIRIPVEYAADMAPYEAGSGELRTHYAGFFDPGFGYGMEGEVKGTKAVLEVRAHDVPFMIAHGQTFCKLYFEKMAEVPEKVYGPKIGSSYQYQGITLSKQFRNDKS